MTLKKQNKIPLFDLKLTTHTKKEVNAVLNSGWLTSGPKVEKFENEMARMLKVPYVTAVSSGTSGLHLALQAIGAGSGMEVITSPLTYVATVEAIIQAGAYPVFADINPATLTIDPRDIKQKISHKTLAIVPVDMAGYPCDYAALNKICDDNSVAMIADSAHAIGAAYKKKSIPNHCDGAVYSFYSTKNLTCGEGGLVATRHKILGNRVRMITGHGLSKSTYKRKKENSWEYDAIAAGYKANMSEIHAAIGLGQLKTYKKDQKTRIDLAKLYLKNLSGLKDYLALPIEEKNYQHGWHLFIVRLNLANLRLDRNQFILEMAKAGVECGVHYKPIFELSFYRDHFGLSRQMFPNTSYAYQSIVTLPLYPLLKKNDIDFVCDKIEKIINKYKR